MRGPGFEEEFETMWKHAWRIAFRVTASTEDAEDVAADTLSRALVDWHRIADPIAWVSRVATRESWKVLKRRVRDREVVATEPGVEPAGVDRIEFVRRLASLPARQREVLAMRYLADMTEQRIADQLRISLATVRKHHERGLGRIRSTVQVAGEPALEADVASDPSSSKGAPHVPSDGPT